MQGSDALAHFQSHLMGAAHLVLAVLAMAAGTAVIATRKGTRRHRWVGRVYLGAMLALNATALAIYELFGRFGIFHWAALLSLISLAVGYVPARRRKKGWRAVHAFWMTGSYVGLLAAFTAEVGTRFLPMPFFWGVGVTSVAVTVVGVALMLKYVPRTLGRRSSSVGTANDVGAV